MAISMTGYGAAELQWESSWSCQVEIRSVNQRFLDVRCRLPVGLQKLESDIKKQIKLTCARGKIDCYIRLEKNSELGGMELNYERAKRFSDDPACSKPAQNKVEAIHINKIANKALCSLEFNFSKAKTLAKYIRNNEVITTVVYLATETGSM